MVNVLVFGNKKYVDNPNLRHILKLSVFVGIIFLTLTVFVYVGLLL